MSVPALNVDEIAKLKALPDFYKMTVADFVREIIRHAVEYDEVVRKKKEIIHQRLANLEEAATEESAEILAYIDRMTEEDHEVMAESVIYV